MEKLNRLLKNTLIFLAIFLAVNYVMQSCVNKEEELLVNSGNILFTTTDTEYSRRQIVTINIENSTKEPIIIPSECPNEPFSIFRYENNDWVQKTSSPELDCKNAKDITLESGDEMKIPYTSWNNTLFSDMGRYRIEFATTVEGENKTITTNEFLVVKEGIFRQLWNGLFYRPIYNALIFIASVIPGHSLGLAIILLTLIIRTILLIPSQKAMKSQRKMQEVQPRLQKIKEKYKGDQQKIAMETMALWKDAKVSPFGSCLPLLLQFPFLIAVFYVVQNGLNPDSVFLFYTDYNGFSLHDIGTNFLGVLELTKPNIYVLPLIIGGLQFFQMKLAMANKNKKTTKKDKKSDEMAMATNMMTYVMPVMIAVFTASLPAGVGIYWGTSTAYGIVQQLFVNKDGGKDPNEPTVKVISN
ncbi:MAG: YidC/Oxa1 family membrane protein insertase [bacterium]|nr:YidC/Oxa1 family membrane protein insertase [bacterium]